MARELVCRKHTTEKRFLLAKRKKGKASQEAAWPTKYFEATFITQDANEWSALLQTIQETTVSTASQHLMRS